MSSNKLFRYAELVTARKACRACAQQGLVNPSCCDNGVHDSSEVGPWTRWQGSLDADLVLVGQDWGDVDYFRRHAGMDVAQNPTNRKLRDLLAEAGFAIEEIGQQESRGTIFLTNAILCLKTGGMGAPVRATWFRECGTRFLRPQIELIRPRAVVALGERAYRALCRVFDVRPRAFREAVESLSAPELIPGARLFPVYHCSPRVLAGTRTFERQQIDWRCIGKALGRPAIVRGA